MVTVKEAMKGEGGSREKGATGVSRGASRAGLGVGGGAMNGGKSLV